MSRISELSDEELERALHEAEQAYWQAWIQTASPEQLAALLHEIEQHQARAEQKGPGGPVYEEG